MPTVIPSELPGSFQLEERSRGQRPEEIILPCFSPACSHAARDTGCGPAGESFERPFGAWRCCCKWSRWGTESFYSLISFSLLMLEGFL